MIAVLGTARYPCGRTGGTGGMGEHSDCAIVGAGILVLAHALIAIRAGDARPRARHAHAIRAQPRRDGIADIT